MNVNPKNFEILTESELDEICNLSIFEQLSLVEESGNLHGWCEALEAEVDSYSNDFTHILNKASATKTVKKLENAENGEKIIDEVVRCVYHNLQNLDYCF